MTITKDCVPSSKNVSQHTKENNFMVKIVAVIGSGTMGAGIAQIAAQSGFDVILYDIAQDILDVALANISRFINRAAEKGRITEKEASDAIARITISAKLESMQSADIVIEAAPEKLELKRDLFKQLEKICRDDAILATNTSTLSVTNIAAGTKKPERVVGMHFFNPAPLMPLVEVAAGTATAQAIVETTVELAKQMGKSPVVTKDVPGFIVNRVARPFYLEALRMIEVGVASHETIDKIVRGAGGFRMGPFQLMDLIGLDINYAASQSVYNAYYHEPRYRPNLLQQRMVESGRLGRKTKRGWYDYSEGDK
jgi:3-hydroxybutyryl-CoA dehydrogenase